MDVKKIIAMLGGTGKVAEMFEIQPPSVSEWIAKNHIPKARMQYLRLARPDVFSNGVPSDCTPTPPDNLEARCSA